jgi:hypothetical protein
LDITENSEMTQDGIPIKNRKYFAGTSKKFEGMAAPFPPQKFLKRFNETNPGRRFGI